MTGLVGTVAIDGRPASTLDVSGAGAVLDGYGNRQSWSGTAGPVSGAIDVYQRERWGGLVEAPEGDLVLAGSVHLTGRDRLAVPLGSAVADGASDLDLVLAGYRRWGTGVLDRIYGDFALALVDRTVGGVMLARDHRGARPLVIHEDGTTVSFATNALALTGVPGVGHELDVERAAEVLLLAYGTDRTFVRGVRWVLPGTAVWIDGRGTRTWRWWNPDQIEIRDLGSLDAHADELRDALELAVAGAVRDAQGVGAMLSGGLDSASVVATAAGQLAPRTIHTYTSAPPKGWTGFTGGRVPDERNEVEALARRWPNLSTRILDVTGVGLFERHEPLWALGAGPDRNPTNSMWIHLFNEEAAADGVSLMLTGAVGNAAFSADGNDWLVELGRRGRFVEMVRETLRWSTVNSTPVWQVFRNHIAHPLVPTWLRRVADRPLVRDPIGDWVSSTALSSERFAEIDLNRVMPRLLDQTEVAWTRDNRHRFLGSAAQADTRSATLALWGVESADPTSDRGLFEKALAQPEWWRRHRGIDRAICRRAMADRLPPEIVNRTTRGAQVPDWYDRLTDMREVLVEEYEAVRDHPVSRDLLDTDRLDVAFREWPERDATGTLDVMKTHMLAMPRALLVSRYLRWFEERGRRVAAGEPVGSVPSR